MKKQEFIGNLEYINPSKLIDKDKNEPVDNFFLVLGLIYNDLKGLVLFKKLIVDNYRIVEKDEISSHSGSLGGIYVQIDRLFIGTVHEIFNFIRDHKDIISSIEFDDILQKTNLQTKSMWKDICGVALGSTKEMKGFSHDLLLIRNNTSFHYNQSEKVLRHSFINIFFNREKVGQNENAYYSIGDSMEGTRFYYADAAAEEYLRRLSQRSEEIDVQKSVDGYSPDLLDIISKMNFTIMRLMKVYLKTRSKNIK